VATWDEVTQAAPQLTAAVKQRFTDHRHAVLATLRADGAPRVSGIETSFAHGQLWLGMMPGSRKGDDLRRDPRFALHSTTDDPDDADPGAWAGDATVSGRAIQVEDAAEKVRFAGTQEQMPSGPFELFRVDIERVTTIRVGDPPDHLVLDAWSITGGSTRTERR
jgi:hypothetical protein